MFHFVSIWFLKKLVLLKPTKTASGVKQSVFLAKKKIKRKITRAQKITPFMVSICSVRSSATRSHRLWLQSVQHDLQHGFAWVTDEADRFTVLALLQAVFLRKCDDYRTELRKKRFEPEGFEKKKAKENWMGGQCSETEENLRKNNSKRANQFLKDLTTVKQGKASTVQDCSGKCLTEEREMLNRWTEYCTSCTITRAIEIHQYWTVPRQTQRMTTPSFAKKLRRSIIIKERQVSWRQKHASIL